MVANSADLISTKRKTLNAIAMDLSKVNNHPWFAAGKKKWLAKALD
jgi:hypothetical protein